MRYFLLNKKKEYLGTIEAKDAQAAMYQIISELSERTELIDQSLYIAPDDDTVDFSKEKGTIEVLDTVTLLEFRVDPRTI